MEKIKLMLKQLLDIADLLCIAMDDVDYEGLPANIANKMRRNLVALDYEIFQLSVTPTTPPTKPTSSDIRTEHTTK